MRPPARQRPERHPRSGLVELICVLVVVVAVILLAVWIVSHSGGGVLNQG